MMQNDGISGAFLGSTRKAHAARANTPAECVFHFALCTIKTQSRSIIHTFIYTQHHHPSPLRFKKQILFSDQKNKAPSRAQTSTIYSSPAANT
jgi:hypothetical protein